MTYDSAILLLEHDASANLEDMFFNSIVVRGCSLGCACVRIRSIHRKRTAISRFTTHSRNCTLAFMNRNRLISGHSWRLPITRDYMIHFTKDGPGVRLVALFIVKLPLLLAACGLLMHGAIDLLQKLRVWHSLT